MAEVSNIFPKNAPEQLNEMTKGLNSTNDATNQLLETTKKLAELLKQNNITYSKLTEAQKKAEGVSKQLTTVEDRIVKNAIKINELNTNRAKTEAAQKVALQAKNKELKDSARLEAANTKAQKENIVIAKAQKGAYDAITAALTKNVAKWKSLTQAERDNTKSGQQLTATIKQQDAALKKLDSQIGRSQRHVGSYKQALKGVATSLLGAFGVVGGVAMFVRVLKGAFSTLRSFTKENAVLAGVLGTTRKEITALTDQAIELGSVYPITASEVVKLQVSFARLGFTMAEIQNLTEATIQGSIALNAELDATATLVGAVVKAYSNLGTSDAQLIIDQLTLATQRSSLSFSSLETALPKVAAAASAMNVPLSKTLSLLGIAQDATLDASVAGTSLRNIFLEIAKRGITLEEALNQIQNSSNRLTTSYELFGKRAAIVGLALADNIEKIGDFDEALKSAGGTAETVAQEQMATLDGAIKGLSSSWEKFVLGFRESEGTFQSAVNAISFELDVLSDNFASSFEKTILAIPQFNLLFGKGMRKNMSFRKEALSFIQGANVEEIKDFKKTYETEINDNEKFAESFEKAVQTRLDTISKSEIDAAKRAKNIRAESEIEEIANAEKIAEARKDAEEKANKEIESERKRHFNELRRENEKFVEDVRKTQRKGVFDAVQENKKAAEKVAETDLEKLNLLQQQAIDANALIVKDEEEKEATKKEIISASFVAAGQIADAITNRRVSNLQKEFDVLMLQKEAELAVENLTAEEKEKIEAKFAKKAAEIKTKQAKAEKRGAIFSILINTAAAVVKALPNLVLAGIAGALGAVQLGIAIAHPIPQFAEGTHGKANTPSEFIAGENKRELMTLKSGQTMLVNEPTHFKGNDFKGATIKSNPETEKILSQSFSSGNVYFDTLELQNEIKSLHKTIRNKPVAIFQDGKMVGSQTGGHREIYLNKLKYGS